MPKICWVDWQAFRKWERNVLEKDVKRAIVEYLISKGAYYHMHVPMGYGKSTLDYLGCYKGLFFGIEAKREKGGKVTCMQERIIREIIAAGGQAWVENSPNLTRTKLVFNTIDEKFSLIRKTTP